MFQTSASILTRVRFTLLNIIRTRLTRIAWITFAQVVFHFVHATGPIFARVWGAVIDVDLTVRPCVAGLLTIARVIVE